MTALVDFFLKRPLVVTLITILVLVFGIGSLLTIRKEGFPGVTSNVVTIKTVYPGASALDVEVNVTIPIEDALDEVSGIKETSSVSQESLSIIKVTANDSASEKQFEKIYDDIEAAVNGVKDLPRDLEGPPTLRQFNTNDMPMLELAIEGERESLKDFVPDLRTKLRSLDGVAQAELIGFPDDEVHILVDPKKAERYQVDLRAIAQAIQARNVEGTGGTVESFISEKKIVTFSKFETYEDVLDTDIRRTIDGYGFKLKDVASLQVAPKDEKLWARSNAKPGASIILKKNPAGDVLKTVDQIDEMLDGLQKPEGVEISMINNISRITRSRLKLLSSNALMGIILVVFLLYIVFGTKTAIWTAFGIPFSVLSVFILLPFLGISLNSITLGAFVVVLGMLVDDAIVVAEQVNLRREAGDDAFTAARRAVESMWRPILAASLTTAVAFSPVIALGGLPGKFVWVLPLIVILSLCASLFESFFILPAHLAVGKPVQSKKRKFVIVLERIYRGILKKALRFRFLILPFFIALFVAALVLGKFFLQRDPFPQEGAEGFIVQVTQPTDVNLETATKNLALIEKEILKLRPEEFEGMSTRIGTHSTMPETDRGTQNNLATIFVYLSPLSDRERTADEMMAMLRQKYEMLPKELNLKTSLELIRLGPPVGKPFEVRVVANDDRVRKAKSAEIQEHLRSLRGVMDVQDDEVAGKSELNLVLNYARLTELGLTAADVLATIRMAFEGKIVTSLVDVNQDLDFRLRLEKSARSDQKFLEGLKVLNNRGRLIDLKEVIKLEERHSNAEIKHVNGKRTTTVFGQLDKTLISPKKVIESVMGKFESTKEVQLSYAGEPKENEVLFANLGKAGLMALLGTYLIITLIFGSFFRPFIVMTVIPFGLIGIVFALITHGMPISIFVMIGFIGLIGITVNGSIVLVHTILGLEGEPETEQYGHILDGATSRLRPILLTTLTTVSGLLPTAYAIGGFDPFISPMCLTLAWGLVFGTLILLFLVPILFTVGLDLKRLFAR